MQDADLPEEEVTDVFSFVSDFHNAQCVLISLN